MLEEKGARLAAGPRQQVSWAGEKRGSGVGCWPSAGWAARGRAGFGWAAEFWVELLWVCFPFSFLDSSYSQHKTI